MREGSQEDSAVIFLFSSETDVPERFFQGYFFHDTDYVFGGEGTTPDYRMILSCLSVNACRAATLRHPLQSEAGTPVREIQRCGRELPRTVVVLPCSGRSRQPRRRNAVDQSLTAPGTARCTGQTPLIRRNGAPNSRRRTGRRRQGLFFPETRPEGTGQTRHGELGGRTTGPAGDEYERIRFRSFAQAFQDRDGQA